MGRWLGWIGAGAASGLLVLAVAGCGSSTTEVADEPAATTAGSAEEPAADETTTTLAAGPIEVRLEGTEDNGAGTYDRTTRVFLDGTCDGEAECTMSRPDGANGFGVGGWEVDLEPTDGTYAYEGVQEVAADACGEPLPEGVGPMEATLSITLAPAAGGTPTISLTEAWSGLPSTDMSDGTLCSGLQATTFTFAS